MVQSCRDVAQLGRALRLGRKGRKFKSCHPEMYGTPRVTGAKPVREVVGPALSLRGRDILTKVTGASPSARGLTG
jgi:hypothetical protein